MKIRQIYRFIGLLAKINYEFFLSSFQKYIFSNSIKKIGRRLPPSVDDVLNQPYVFVLSTGRCGTALMTDILSKSSKLRVEHDPKPGLEYVSSLIHREEISVEALTVAVLAARFDLFFLDSFLRGKIYVETNNRISLFSPALAKLLPNAKFIHLVRNPADFVRSGMRRGYYLEGVGHYHRLDGSRYAPWSSFSRLGKIAWEWNEINGKIEHFKSSVEASRVLTINSESLYKDPLVVGKIFEFIEIENPFSSKAGSSALAKMLLKPVNEQKDGDFPKYQNWDDGHKSELQRVATLASTYGYFFD